MDNSEMLRPPDRYADNLFLGVNEAVDSRNLSDLEKKHIPVIEVPETVKKGEYFEVRVKIGKLLAHPNEYKHFIQFVELYADDTYLARSDLTAIRTCPQVSFWIALQHPSKELRAYEHCNLHGKWVGRTPIVVTD